jgi:hypothetical protein
MGIGKLEIHACSNRSPIFSKHLINMKYFEMANAGSHSNVAMTTRYFLIFIFLNFFEKSDKIYSWKIRTFSYTTNLVPRAFVLTSCFWEGPGIGYNLHPKFWGVNKLKPLNFNARNWFVLQNFLYLLLQDKVHFIYF